MPAALDVLRARIEEHLAAETGGRAVVKALAPLGGGACQDNYEVRVDLESGALAGDRRLVLRSDAVQSLPGSIDRRQEFEVIVAAVAAGVKTPAARWLGRGLVRDGAWAYFLDWIDGEAIGRKVLRDPALAEARARLPGELAAVLARIHSITPEAPRGVGLPPIADPAGAALRFARRMMDALPEPRPALELAMRWLADHLPPKREVTLVHGDFRTGNLMLTPAGLTGVLDWEFAHWGSPAEDLAWIALRNWRFGQNDRPIGGFAARDELYLPYGEATGHAVERREVHFWEVLGNVRWAAGCVLQGERYLTAGERDLELIAIPLRAAEMEHEALRLIERGH